MSANRKLSHFTYRKAILDIELNGYGNRIASFVLDGKEQNTHLIPPTLTGKHLLKIVLANNDPEKQPIHLVKNEFTPLVPIVTFSSGKLSWNSIEGVAMYRILKNGKQWNETKATSCMIPSNEYGEFQVEAIDKNNIHSFAGEPVEIYAESSIQFYEIEKYLPVSNLPYHGFSGTGFVEISRTINRTVNIDINISLEGLYAIDWKYSNGNGPTNTENKCALRTLFVDDTRIGAQIFPQRGIKEWSNWGFSNAVQVQFRSGLHHVRLEFMPENENMNIDINQAMLDYLRVVKL